MNFDDMQRQWKSQDEKLEQTLQVHTAGLRLLHVNAAATALGRVGRSIGIELFFNAIALLILGTFVSNHLDAPRFLLPALLLHGCAIASIAAGVRQLLMLRQVDYSGPIVAVQRTLTSLRRSRIRTWKWTLLVSPLLWVPLLIVSMKGLLGLDAYAIFDTAWIAVNILAGAALIPLMLWLAHHYRDRMAGSPLLQRLADDLAGENLNEANAFLQQIARFENVG